MHTNFRFVLSTILLAAVPSLASEKPATDPTAAEIDAIFADYDRTTSPGCALGVVRDGQMMYRRGYGMANLEYGMALTPASVFRTASVGKQFTAMAIAILDEQGKISLDDPLSQLFPEFPEWADRVTLRHLVHHTSGIRDYLTLAWLAGKGDEDNYSDEFALDLLARQRELNFPPGDDHLYSNSGYLLLAHTVERATGQSLREWAAENLFGPLEMTSSHFHDDHTHIVPRRADGYAPTEDGFRISMTTLDMVGDGGVYTTVEDFLAWDRNFYDNRLGKGGQNLIATVTTPGTLNHDEPMTYAFGLDVDEYRGLPAVAHGGGFVGFRTYTLRFPQQRLSVVVYCNRGDADPSGRARKVAELFLGDLMDPSEVPEAETGAEVEPAEVSLERLRQLSGHYWNEERRSSWELAVNEGDLHLLISEDESYPLIPISDDEFVLRTQWFAAQLTFQDREDGVLELAFRPEGADEPRLYQRFTPRQPTMSDLEAYTGTYRSDELGVSYTLEVEDGALQFRIVRHEAHELEPLFDEIFGNSDYGTFEFRRSDDGTVEGFNLDAGRVRNLDFVRQ